MISIQLAGDIGGTKTTLALVDAGRGPRALIHKTTYPSANYATFEALVADYLKDKEYTLQRATFGVAGPVIEGSVRTTNLPWLIEEDSLSRAIGAPVGLLNDLSSIANAVPLLTPADIETLNPGDAVEEGAIGVIAPGTGLGEAFLQWHDGAYRAYASEGGHVDFAPIDTLQWKLLGYLQEKFGHVSYERVCSGMGLPYIYLFLKESGAYPEPDWLCEQMSAVSDPSPVISGAALEGRAEIAEAALNMFVSVLGSEAGNLALKVLATGGIYLGGGIPPRILPFLKKPIFLEAFCRKGRFAEMLSKIPIHVILNPEVALMGAAWHGISSR